MCAPSLRFPVKTLAAFVCAVVFSPGSLGQNQNQLDEVIVISSRIATPLRRIGTSVSVLTEADMEAHGNASLTDVLRQLPAISTSSNGGAGKTVTMRIRGEDGFRTITLFDGLRLSDPSSPQMGPQLEHILSSGIGRVEVLRGPQGLGYGADAGGVLNISSRQATEGLHLGVDAQHGRFGTDQYSTTMSGAAGNADFFLALADFGTEGFNTRSVDTVLADDDGYENTTFHGRAGIDLGETLRLDLVHRQVEGRNEYDSCGTASAQHDCVGLNELAASRAALSYRADGFAHALAYSTTDTDRDNLTGGISTYAAQGNLDRWEYSGSATELPGFDLVFGADLESAGNNGKVRDNEGVYLEYLSDFSSNLYFTAGARHDDNEDFGSNTSYRISAAWLIDFDDSTLKFKGSQGTGFRAPSPFEIAYNAGPAAGPPASSVRLVQETSRGHELGLEYLRGDALRLEAVYFDQQIEDAIAFDMAGFSGYLQDSGVSSSKGMELAAMLAIGQRWRLSGNYTWNDTQRPNGTPRLRRPEHLYNFGISWHGPGEKLALNTFARVSRNSADEVAGRFVSLDDFAVVDFSGSYRLSESLELYARVENVLGERYQEIATYNTAQRATYLGFRLHFQML